MKMFLKWFAVPILIAVVASGLYIVDALIGGLFVKGGSFMWVAFAIWTIFYGAKMTDRIKGFIGVVIGFGAAVVMMAITGSFSANIATISISCLVGVFVVNALVMYMNKLDKVWLSSVTGAFAGIFLTFSNLGVGLNPLASVDSTFTMLGILIVYTVFGLVCGFLSIYFSAKINKKLESLQSETVLEEKRNEEVAEQKQTGKKISNKQNKKD